MKEQHKIPTSKVHRAMKLVGTGAKIGSNYLKYYAEKTIGDQTKAKEHLHQNNATDIYNGLSKLKGSALKVAQMLSMDKNLLPQAYHQKFALSQYSAPPLSAPLVLKTFTQSIGKSPSNIFDYFNLQSSAAASIGQVHEAKIGNKKFAVKVQYPGIAQSIHSDLKIVKPIAQAMFGLPDKEMAKYFEEVEEKLLEETDYGLELRRSIEISEKCKEIENVVFPTYYPKYSGNKVLTMDWMEGLHLSEFLATNPSQEAKNTVANALWKLYEFQLHTLKAIHADPHPGNFLIQDDGKVGVIDFGCVKEIPTDFYYQYFPLLLAEIQNNPAKCEELLLNIEVIFNTDSDQVKNDLTTAFLKMTKLLSSPFTQDEFHFTTEFINSIYELGDEIYQMPEVKKPTQSRGSKHALYINRTYFGIYAILADLNATVQTKRGIWAQDLLAHHNN